MSTELWFLIYGLQVGIVMAWCLAIQANLTRVVGWSGCFFLFSMLIALMNVWQFGSELFNPQGPGKGILEFLFGIFIALMLAALRPMIVPPLRQWLGLEKPKR